MNRKVDALIGILEDLAKEEVFLAAAVENKKASIILRVKRDQFNSFLSDIGEDPNKHSGVRFSHRTYEEDYDSYYLRITEEVGETI